MSIHRRTSAPRKTPQLDSPNEAARLFLEGTAQKLRLGAIAVANEDGLLVFGSLGPASGIFDLEALAAVGPLMALGRAPKDLLDLAGSGKPVNACRLDVGGQTLFLTSVGPKGPNQSDAESALRQILVA